ncbi:MAG TPA: hypothetical protein VFT18_02870 [Gaiellaceae bacterium]|nr:hypothetical protein [Gaiellaceae bacterium]
MVTTRRLFAAAVAIAVLAAVGVGLVAWKAWDGTGGPGLGDQPIVGTALLDPESHLFGDAVRARVELIVDTTRVDPGSIDVGANFEPYRELRPVERSRADNGSLARLRYDYLLGCLTAGCLPKGSGRVELGGVAVNYTRRGAVEPDASTIDWVPIRVAGRIDPNQLEQAALRSDLRSLPPPSYTVSPRTVELVALALAVLLALAAAILALRLLPLDRLADRLGARFVDRRSSLEQALALVRESSTSGSTEEGRRALERLAVELRRSRNPALAADASRLAWSQDRPVATGVGSLSDEVQRLISENGR